MHLLRWLNKRSFFSSLISLSFSSLSVIAETISVDDTNGTIQYFPQATEGAPSLWSSHLTQVGYNYTSTSTSSSQASAEFSFQGIAIYLGSVISKMSSDLNITLDGQHHIVHVTRPGGPKSTTVFSIGNLQPSVQHRMIIQKASTATTSSTEGDTDGSVLDIDFISYTVLDNDAVPDNDAGHNTTAQPANTPTVTVPLTDAAAKSHVSAGKLAAIVIATLLGVIIGVTIMIFTRRRRLHIPSKPQVSPLVLRDRVRLPPPPPAAPRRPQFRTENLPHFVAPPSVWNLPSGSDISSAPHQAPPIRPPHIEREKRQTTLVVANPSSSHGHQSSLSTIDHHPLSPQLQDDTPVISSSEVQRDEQNTALDVHTSRRTHLTAPPSMSPPPAPPLGPRGKKKRIFFAVNPASDLSSS